jgi:hypothetical protein
MPEALTISNPQIVLSAVQIPTELLRLVRSHRLTSAEYSFWLYLCEIAPSGDFTDIPPPEDIARELRINPRTVERAARRLSDLNLFTFQTKSWRASNSRVTAQNQAPTEPISTTDYSSGKEIHLPTERSISPQNRQNLPYPLPLEPQALSGFSTVGLVPEQESFKNLNIETDLGNLGLPNLSVPDVDKESTGTLFARMSRFLVEVGFTVNNAIQATLKGLIDRLEPSEFRKRVENAASAVQEQIQRGNLKRKEPEALLQTALQRGFTSNAAKKTARLKREKAQAEQILERTKVPPPPPVLKFPKFDEVEASRFIDSFIFKGDRAQALVELQRQWIEGFRDDLINLLRLRRDWGFVIGAEGPQESGQ